MTRTITFELAALLIFGVLILMKIQQERSPAEANVLSDPRKSQMREDAPGCKHLLIYNRVPKCGSNSIKSALTRLHKANSYQFLTWEQLKKNASKTDLLACLTTTCNGAMAFQGYCSFVKPENAGFETTYINFVREPVDRFVSWYYFQRRESKLKKTRIEIRKLSNKASGRAKLTALENWQKRKYFCGHEDYCSSLKGEQALSEAMYNVEKYYKVVGVLERKKESDYLLATLLPRFFKGLVDLGPIQANVGILRQHTSAKLTKEAEHLLRAVFAKDIEFYNFVLQRLERQLKELANPRHSPEVGDDVTHFI